MIVLLNKFRYNEINRKGRFYKRLFLFLLTLFSKRCRSYNLYHDVYLRCYCKIAVILFDPKTSISNK